MIKKYDDRFQVKYNDQLPDAIICDLDGTLALLNGRSPYSINEDILTDRVNDPIKNIILCYNDFVDNIIYISGRKESARHYTEKWLVKNGIFDYSNLNMKKHNYTKLYMRKDDDNRKDEIIKKEIYDDYIKDEYNVLFVLDDRDQVVKMWRDLGLTCLQVYYGNF